MSNLCSSAETTHRASRRERRQEKQQQGQLKYLKPEEKALFELAATPAAGHEKSRLP